MCLTGTLLSKFTNNRKSTTASEENDEGIATHSDDVDFIHPAIQAGTSRIRLSIFIPAFLAFFGISISDTPLTNQLLYQTCIYQYHYSVAECEPLLGKVPKTNQTTSIENQVQAYVTYQLTVETLITNILPAILCIAVGPWSDKFGRRLMIILALIGYLLDFVLLSIFAAISNSNFNSWLFLVPSVPVAFSGGKCLLTTMVFAYVSDTYSTKSRAIGMIIAQVMISAGDGVGSIAGGIIYDQFNLLTTFIVSAISVLLALLYFTFVNVESLRVQSQSSKIRGLFSLEIVRNFWLTSTKKRLPYHRVFIWCIIFIVIILNFIQDGEANILYLFLSKKFDWSLSTYNLYKGIISTVYMLSCCIGAAILIYYLKMSAILLIFIVMILNVAGSIIIALAAYSWQIYAAGVVSSLQYLAVPILRTILSMLVTESEVGTIFSVNNSLQYLLAIGATPLYNGVYALTLAYDPALYNYVSAVFYCMCIILAGILLFLRSYLKLQLITK